MQTKLTLRVDDRLIKLAKRYAKRRGKSVSQMVADYFALLGSRSSESTQELSPTVQSLKGILRGSGVDKGQHRQHVEDKYL